MDRRDAARQVAEVAYAKAVSARMAEEHGVVEPYEGAHEARAKLAIEAAVGDAFGRDYAAYIGRAIEDGRKELASIRLGHVEFEDDDEKTRLQALREACERAIAEIDELAAHRCAFTADDYCSVCGLDGRA